MSPPSERQMRFLEELQDLVGVSRLQVGDVVTAANASAAINRLLDLRDGGAPIRHATRQAVFAGLREAGVTKEEAYAAVASRRSRTAPASATAAAASRGSSSSASRSCVPRRRHHGPRTVIA